MSKTFRRVNFEKTSRKKEGSSIAGFYTTYDLIPKKDPNSMMVRPVYEYDPFLYPEVWRRPRFCCLIAHEDTKILATKWVRELRAPTKHERNKKFWRIHRDSHHHWGISKTTRNIEESKYRANVRKSVSQFLKKNDDIFISDFPMTPLD